MIIGVCSGHLIVLLSVVYITRNSGNWICLPASQQWSRESSSGIWEYKGERSECDVSSHTRSALYCVTSAGLFVLYSVWKQKTSPALLYMSSAHLLMFRYFYLFTWPVSRVSFNLKYLSWTLHNIYKHWLKNHYSDKHTRLSTSHLWRKY